MTTPAAPQETQTPRTDAASFPMGAQMYHYVDANFARALERELSAAQARVAAAIAQARGGR